MAEHATILVADREQSILHLLRGVLKGTGYEVLGAQDAESALEAVEKNDVDLALVDEGLPEIGGLGFSQEISQRELDVVIATMGPCGAKRSALAEMACGVHRRLLKPFEDSLAIRRLVEECLEERKNRLQQKLALDTGSGDDDEKLKHEGAPVRVLLADSDDDERKQVNDALSRHSCEIVEATCAQEALLLLGKGEYDVLVVGYDMGDMTADDVMLRAKRLDDKVAVVVTATNPTLKMTTSLIKRGAAGFVEKPLKDPGRTASAIIRQGINARDRRDALVHSSSKKADETDTKADDKDGDGSEDEAEAKTHAKVDSTTEDEDHATAEAEEEADDAETDDDTEDEDEDEK